jgi:hypothetical protein
MEYVVWKSLPVGNACMLDDVENVEKSSGLPRGVPFVAKFPADAVMHMTDRHKKDTALTDDISSFSSLKVCSPRIVDFLRKKQLKNLEFLPITILDHKDKVASKDYCIVHPIHPQDALDLDKSQPKYNPIMKTEISDVAQLVLDPARIDPEVRLFRLKAFIFPVLLEKSIADEMAGMGLKGPLFKPLSEYRR